MDDRGGNHETTVSLALKLKVILHTCDLSEEIKTKCVASKLVSKQAFKVNAPLHVTRFHCIARVCSNPILELRSRAVEVHHSLTSIHAIEAVWPILYRPANNI